MQRRIGSQRHGRVWVERIVWNAAATAVLAVMIVVLLCSLRWLDQIDPEMSGERAAAERRTSVGSNRPIDASPAHIVRVNGPDG